MIRCGDHTFTKLLPELISLPPENFLGLPSFCILHMENSTFSLTFPHYQDKHHVNSRFITMNLFIVNYHEIEVEVFFGKNLDSLSDP